MYVAPNPAVLAANPSTMSERAPRKRVLKGALAAFNEEFSAIPCTIRNISETGAKVQFEGGWFVPDRFTLHVKVDGYKAECERVWHRGSECGVRFTSEKIRTGAPRQQSILRQSDGSEETGSIGTARPREPETSALPRNSAARRAGFGQRTR